MSSPSRRGSSLLIPGSVLTLALGAALALGVVKVRGGCEHHAEAWPAQVHAATPAEAAERVRQGKGDVVLFVLYASWCADCRAELPGIDEMALKYEGRGLRVVAFTLDEDPSDFAELVAERPLHFEMARVAPLDHPALTGAVRGLGGKYADTIPYVAVFDRGGALLHDWSGAHPASEIEATVQGAL